MRSDIVLKLVQVFVLSLLIIPHSSLSLFEKCDERYNLDTDESLIISSRDTLNDREVSSCRYIITAPAHYNVKVSCELRFDQPDSTYCRTKRFFVSIDGIISLSNAHNFCNRNGTIRIIKRRSVMNRLVMAYVSKRDLEDETFTCTAWRIKSKCECGWSKRARIYNGENAQMHEFPSMIALIVISLNKVFCGGAIISEKYGLTGAHCFNEPIYSNLSNVVAFVGEHDLSVQNETSYTESYELEEYIRHESYTKHSFNQDYDIALIKFKRPIAFNLAVGPICLPFNYDHSAFDSTYVYAIGFGYLKYHEAIQATILQKVSLKILPAKKCSDSEKNPYKMCTYEKDKDSCISDSGGPLIHVSKGRQYVVGLISYGIACGTTTPSVNTRITSYLSWIMRNTEDEKFCRN